LISSSVSVGMPLYVKRRHLRAPTVLDSHFDFTSTCLQISGVSSPQTSSFAITASPTSAPRSPSSLPPVRLTVKTSILTPWESQPFEKLRA
jgi:hypothetical protein